MRRHRLRERRLKLGATQFLIGCLADWPVSSAQSMVSAVERGGGGPRDTERVRRAILWLELEPRRRRQAELIEAAAIAATEAAILLNRRDVIKERLVVLLTFGEADEFDALAARVDESIVDDAGDEYLDRSFPATA